MGKDKIVVERVSEKFTVLCKRSCIIHCPHMFVIVAPLDMLLYFMSQLLQKFQRFN